MIKLIVFATSLVLLSSLATCQITNNTYNGDVLLGSCSPPVFNISMELPAIERYAEIGEYFAGNMLGFQEYFIYNITHWSGVPFLGNIAVALGRVIGLLYPDREVMHEVQAWAQIMDVNLGLLYVFSILYEATAFDRSGVAETGLMNVKMCTGIVATNTNGETFHGRNWDFAFE
jgi:hypothetical protein